MKLPAQRTQSSDPGLTFLKLGGSLITDKTNPGTVRQGILETVCKELSEFILQNPDHRLILGHGSGSYGHVPAERYGTREGVNTPAGWLGFSEVWKEAALLNHRVLDTLFAMGVRAICFPPSAAVMTSNREVIRWDLAPVRDALRAHLVPITYGDVVFDAQIGGTILSTEEIFSYLSWEFNPGRILLAGAEEGVWDDFSDQIDLIGTITPQNSDQILPRLGGAAGYDVTGGMAKKVAQMLDLVSEQPGLEVVIFSGLRQGNLTKALRGVQVGTTISNKMSENQ